MQLEQYMRETGGNEEVLPLILVSLLIHICVSWAFLHSLLSFILFEN